MITREVRWSACGLSQAQRCHLRQSWNWTGTRGHFSCLYIPMGQYNIINTVASAINVGRRVTSFIRAVSISSVWARAVASLMMPLSTSAESGLKKQTSVIKFCRTHRVWDRYFGLRILSAFPTGNSGRASFRGQSYLILSRTFESDKPII